MRELYSKASDTFIAFRTSAPKIWNSLSPHILQSLTLSSFRRHLKGRYFQSAYPAP